METTVISGASVKTGSLAIVYSDIVQMTAKEAGGGPRVNIEKEKNAWMTEETTQALLHGNPGAWG